MMPPKILSSEEVTSAVEEILGIEDRMFAAKELAASHEALRQLFAEEQQKRVDAESNANTQKGVGELGRSIIELNRRGMNELIDVLVDVLEQACDSHNGVVDSMALSAYARGLKLLAKHGRFQIDHEVHRRILGQFITDHDQTPEDSRRPVPGSQEWAETYLDDLGESPDY